VILPLTHAPPTQGLPLAGVTTRGSRGVQHVLYQTCLTDPCPQRRRNDPTLQVKEVRREEEACLARGLCPAWLAPCLPSCFGREVRRGWRTGVGVGAASLT
jgi:hypothetical protein